MENFQIIFKELLKDEELSMLAFCKKVGINSRTARRWYENEIPNLKSLCIIADFFKCSLDYLVGRSIIYEYVPIESKPTFLFRYNLLKEETKLNDNKVWALCKISKGTVSKWKNGSIPSFYELLKLCKVFDCSLDYLVGHAD